MPTSKTTKIYFSPQYTGQQNLYAEALEAAARR